GFFFRVPNDRPDRLDIYLSRMVRLAVVSGSCREAEFEWVTPKGQRLAHVSRHFAPAANEWLIDTDDCLEQEPIVKMLLLAGVLVLAYNQTG
ncbi:MAG TPA: hypothetical protein VKS79_07110, partial [Gemmataceae bacterium]|nr:hypothetical protein [Gemmataceae bacterium]